MPQVASWDYDNRRVHLSFDTVSSGVDFAAAYLEERAYRSASAGTVRGRRPMMQSNGFIPKGGGRFTPRFVTFLEGARPVPYDTSHTLDILVEPITDDELSGIDVFDRAPLSPSTAVDINASYQQVEVIVVSTSGSTGGATLTNQQSILAALTAIQGLNFTSEDSLVAIAANLLLTLQSAQATAKGRFKVDYTNGTAIQYDSAGNELQPFWLYQADGTTRANSQSNAVERRPQ